MGLRGRWERDAQQQAQQNRQGAHRPMLESASLSRLNGLRAGVSLCSQVTQPLGSDITTFDNPVPPVSRRHVEPVLAGREWLAGTLPSAIESSY